MKKHEYLMHILGVDCLDSFGDFRDIIHIHIGYTIKDNSSCFDLYTTTVNTRTLIKFWLLYTALGAFIWTIFEHESSSP